MMQARRDDAGPEKLLARAAFHLEKEANVCRLDYSAFIIIYGAPLAFEIQSNCSPVLQGLNEERG